MFWKENTRLNSTKYYLIFVFKTLEIFINLYFELVFDPHFTYDLVV